jgi:hypothetical protein
MPRIARRPPAALLQLPANSWRGGGVVLPQEKHVKQLAGILVAAALAACGPSETPPTKSTTVAITATDPPPAAGPFEETVPELPPDITELYPYSLDPYSREVAPKGRVKCPEVELVSYRGDVIRLHKRARVYVDFVPKLHRFEEIVRDTAIEFYGRAPRRIKHLGTYYCRRIRAWPTYISEHGMGNAIDVEGFDFAWVSKNKAPDVPARLRRAFRIRVEDHWNATRGTGATHSKFLRELAQRLIDEEGLFRVMLGPAEPGHQDHFHFDAAPWRIVNIFEQPELSDADPGLAPATP